LTQGLNDRHRTWTLFPKLYNGPPLPSKLPIPVGGSGPPCNAWFLNLAHPSPQPKGHFDRFSRFYWAHDGKRQTDHDASVTLGRNYVRSTAMRPNSD